LARALRRQPALTHQPLPAPDPRADELREKLADAREAVVEREEDEAAETPIDQAAAPGEDLVERRRKLHTHGHAVAGEMRRRSAEKPTPEEE
jgi:DNA segregation ATPase FtsK/SpoIIIE-like protein